MIKFTWRQSRCILLLICATVVVGVVTSLPAGAVTVGYPLPQQLVDIDPAGRGPSGNDITVVQKGGTHSYEITGDGMVTKFRVQAGDVFFTSVVQMKVLRPDEQLRVVDEAGPFLIKGENRIYEFVVDHVPVRKGDLIAMTFLAPSFFEAFSMADPSNVVHRYDTNPNVGERLDRPDRVETGVIVTYNAEVEPSRPFAQSPDSIPNNTGSAGQGEAENAAVPGSQDTTPPTIKINSPRKKSRVKIVRRKGKVKAKTLKVKGIADSDVVKVELSVRKVAKRAKGRKIPKVKKAFCSYFKDSKKMTRAKRCSASLTFLKAKGTSNWSTKIKLRKRGKYEIYARAIDTAGNISKGYRLGVDKVKLRVK